MNFIGNRLTVLVFGAVLLWCLADSPAQPPAHRVDESASVVTRENVEQIKAGKGKLTEGDVLALLGRPNRYMIQGQGILEMVWEDVNRVRVVFEDGKAKFFWADFSERRPSLRVSLEKFRKLRTTMTEDEVKSVLGLDLERYVGPRHVYGNLDPIHDLAVPKGVTLGVWQDWRRLTVQFTDGTVTGHSMAE